MANNERTRAAAKTALDAYRALPGFDGEEEETSISDLITDLMHYADAQGYSAELVADRASGNYYDEVDDDLEVDG